MIRIYYRYWAVEAKLQAGGSHSNGFLERRLRVDLREARQERL
jgi:hypothetical protein